MISFETYFKLYHVFCKFNLLKEFLISLVDWNEGLYWCILLVRMDSKNLKFWILLNYNKKFLKKLVISNRNLVISDRDFVISDWDLVISDQNLVTSVKISLLEIKIRSSRYKNLAILFTFLAHFDSEFYDFCENINHH